MAFGQLISGAGFLRHLAERLIGQFGDVLVAGDSVFLEIAAEDPASGDDLGCGHGFSVIRN